jgi:3',5'-cyclic AMP phosphodiesterase CpdA
MVFRILHVSDTHISDFGQFNEKMYYKFLESIDKLSYKPDLVIHTGDVVDNGTLSEYTLAKDLINQLNYKKLLTTGNHDERNYGGTLFNEFFGNSEIEYEVGKFKIFILSSSIPDRDEGRLGRRRQSYLQSRFLEIGDKYFKIVVFHHHLIPVPYSGREVNVLEDAGDVLHMILKNNVNMVLMGHRHIHYSLRINNTILAYAGTVSSRRTRGHFGNSYNLIEIDDDRVHIEEIKIEGGVGMKYSYKIKPIYDKD